MGDSLFSNARTCTAAAERKREKTSERGLWSPCRIEPVFSFSCACSSTSPSP
uniref:Uncharacterized protein n=1 Tax=Nelumbo nucifera TaxID=4432 RepID=A0A822Y2U4_NELNU|nr:TPA_asm: hypothetical protein HUJ06_029702 [Nelumbo nucifera]